MQHVLRRNVYRAMFIVLCIVPTVLVLLWARTATARREAERVQAVWESRVLAETGLLGKADAVELGSRGDVTFINLVLSDPETRAVVARIRRVHLAPASERGWVIEVSFPEIAAGQLARLWEPLYDRLRSARGGDDWTGLILARHATILQDPQPHTLTELECQFGNRKTGGFARIDFLLAGYKMNEKARIVVSRDRDSAAAPQTVVNVLTGPKPLPCSLLGEVVPAIRQLGEQAHFVGEANWRKDAGGWRGERMAGRLMAVDFSTLVTRAFPHHFLSGWGDVEIERAEFAAGRLVAAAGTLHSTDGRIGRSLLLSAKDWLGCELPQSLAAQDRYSFTHLALSFQIDDAGLTLRGRCPTAGAILENAHGPLLVEGVQPIPVVGLLRMLVPDNAVQVPATRQTGWLSGVLPLPSVVPSQRTAIRPLDAPPLQLRTSRQ